MNCLQSISCPSQGSLVGPNSRSGRSFFSLSRTLYSNPTCLQASPYIGFCRQKVYPSLVHYARKSERCARVCASGRSGNSTGGDEPFSWESLKKVFGSFRRELTVQDMLRQQERQKQFYGDGDDGISGRGGGGGGGGGDGSNGPDDEGFAGKFDEFVQVFLAILGIVLLYIFLLNGEDLTRLIKDFIKYLFGGKPSIRLKRKMDELHRFYKSLAWKEVKYREDWLEREIIRTPTVWHKPEQLAHLVETYLENYKRQDE
ncbi:uncharacterized protein LOC122049048 isoform X2 [Zingiber officinale]|uniref:Glycine-rich protein n=1 Tax=Zingiber officinale TaxID=94328 RepID=A0A8J5HMY6_ZINOF|nr:uncharacterized protein LOC122049048 isoform X2 [Zingiber officinale]XP_042466490.1 uncharacterized protein LOC122049048 isoform X2 [Zingiber officinale]KAG6531217.1 hypothetical protein ZIOFF_005007 [Zingiber officinale]